VPFPITEFENPSPSLSRWPFSVNLTLVTRKSAWILRDQRVEIPVD
jgi:hypothetical protein